MEFFKSKKVSLNASAIASFEIAKVVVKWLLQSEDYSFAKVIISCNNEGHERGTDNPLQLMGIKMKIFYRGKAYTLDLSILITKDGIWNLAPGSSPTLKLSQDGYPLILLQRRSVEGISFSSDDEVLENFRKMIV